MHKFRGVVREGQKGLKPPFKFQRNAVFLLLIYNEELNFETPSEQRIPCVKSREFYNVTKIIAGRKSKNL